MIQSAYSVFKRTAADPIEKWEQLRDASTDPKERADMQIAIDARRHMEAKREAQINP